MSQSPNLPSRDPEVIEVPRSGLSADRVKVSHAEYGFSGPIPPPQFLAQYDSAFPGSAERIICLAEAEAQHRRSIEMALVTGELNQHVRDSNEARRGQICAIIIVLASLVAGTYTAMNGHEWAGSILGVGGIGGIVTTFVLGRKTPKQETSKPESQSGNARNKNQKTRRN